MSGQAFYSLTDWQKSAALNGLSAVTSLNVPQVSLGKRFVAYFDGTNNSVFGPPPPPGADEQQTTVGRVFKELGKIPGVREVYLGGVGASMESGQDPSGSSTFGTGCIERANKMYEAFKAFVVASAPEGQLTEKINIDVLGFSRGTGSARHFMNMVDKLGIPNPKYPSTGSEYLIAPKEGRFSCLLFDSVVTGQETELDLGIPASCDFALHLCAADERRSLFNMTSILPSAGYAQDPRLNEIWLPGVHSDVGGSWLSHAALLSELAAQSYLRKRGLIDEIKLSEKALEQVASLDATWYTAIEGMFGTSLPESIPQTNRQIFSYMDGYPWEPNSEQGTSFPSPSWLNEPLSSSRIAELQQLYPGWAQPWMAGQDSPAVINAQGSSVLADRDGGSTLNGSSQSDWAFAGLQSVLNMGAGNDYLYGSGSALLRGGTGNDVYVVKAGDQIDDADSHGRILIQAQASDVQFTRSGTTVLVSWANQQNGPVQIHNWFVENGNGTEPVSFSVEQRVGARYSESVTAFSAAEISRQALILQGMGESNYFVGLLGYSNTFQARGGDDVLMGADKADTYLYAKGDGHDTITEQSDATGQLDKLQLSGLQLQDAGFTRSGDDLRIVFAGGGSVTVKSWFPAGENRRIENVTFDDATLTADEVTARIGVVLDDGPNNYTGTNYNDIIYGMGGADTLSGDPYQGAADDVLHGGAGNDILYGGRGRDFLYGGADNDVLDGGNGADFLSGGPGADVLGGEYGQLTYDPGWYPSYGYTGELVGNTYDGGTGNDRLNGSTGADTYLFDLGWGADTLYEQDNPNLRVTDVIWFGAGISSADIRVSRQNLDLVLSHVNGQDSITLKSWFGNYTSTVKQVEEIRFQNGTVWSAASLTAQCQIQQGDDEGNKLDGLSGYANQLFGNGGADQVYGGGYNDLLAGGTGNDYLWGGNGSDTFQYFRGDGYDTVQDPSGSDRILFEGITLSEAQFFRIGNDLEVFLGTGQGVRVTNHFGAYIGGPQPVEFLVFADQQVSSSQFNAWANPKT